MVESHRPRARLTHEIEAFWLWESGGGVTESRIDHRWANEEATKAFVPLHPPPPPFLSVTYSSFKLPIIFVHTHTPLDVSPPYSHIDTILDSSFKHRIFQAKSIARTMYGSVKGSVIRFFLFFSYNVLRFVRIMFPH